MHLADLDGDGKDEVYVLSEQEKQIGRSTLTEGRITFPSPLPISGEPVAMDLADLDGDKKSEVVYIAKGKSTSGSDTFDLRALRRDASGTFKAYAWGPTELQLVSIAGLSGPPVGLETIDVNRDGLADFLVFPGYGSPVLLLGRKGQPPLAFIGSLGPMAAATPSGLSLMDLNGPALIVAQNTFARQIQLDSKGNGNQDPVQFGPRLGRDPGCRGARCRRRRHQGSRLA